MVQEWGAGTEKAPIRAVLIFTDPADWYLDLQLCCDLVLGNGTLGDPAHHIAHTQPSERPQLHSTTVTERTRCGGATAAELAAATGAETVQRAPTGANTGADSSSGAVARRVDANAASARGSADGGGSSDQQPQPQHGVHIFAAQNDLLWSNGFPVSRFGLGAFVSALRTLLAEVCAMKGVACPEVHFFGKPTAAPYRRAEAALDAQADELGALSGSIVEQNAADTLVCLHAMCVATVHDVGPTC